MGGAFLSQPITEKKTTKYQHGKLRVVCCEMQGWRKYMQDAIVFHRISKQIFLFAIFDGHGGIQVSQYCAKQIPVIIQNLQSFRQKNYQKALEQTFKQLDDKLGSQDGEKHLRNISIQNGLQPFQNSKVAQSVGCTANVALLVDKILYVANAGDSRCGVSRKGQLIQMSFDHKPNDPKEYQRITTAGGTVEGGRINNHLNLSRSLGDLYYKKNDTLSYEKQIITGHPDIKTLQLCKDDDFIIMGCDGVWQRYEKNGQQLVDLIRTERMKGKAPQKVLQDMLDGFLGKDPTKEQLGCDNMSCMLIQLNKNAF